MFQQEAKKSVEHNTQSVYPHAIPVNTGKVKDVGLADVTYKQNQLGKPLNVLKRNGSNTRTRTTKRFGILKQSV